MPRAKPKHRSHVTFTPKEIVGKPERDSICQSLTGRGYPKANVKGLISALNMAVTHAYELEPLFPTVAESRAWHETLLKAIDRGEVSRVRDLLVEAGEIDPEWSLDWMKVRLPAYRAHYETEHARFKKVKHRKRRNSRQVLAQELVRLWRENFGEWPMYRIDEKVEIPLSPFITFLDEVIQIAEGAWPFQVPEESEDPDGEKRTFVKEGTLRDLIKNARKQEKRRRRLELKHELRMT